MPIRNKHFFPPIHLNMHTCGFFDAFMFRAWMCFACSSRCNLHSSRYTFCLQFFYTAFMSYNILGAHTHSAWHGGQHQFVSTRSVHGVGVLKIEIDKSMKRKGIYECEHFFLLDNCSLHLFVCLCAINRSKTQISRKKVKISPYRK